MNFKLINPGSSNKLRDLDITLYFLTNNVSCEKLGVIFNLSVERINKIIGVFIRNLLNSNRSEIYDIEKYKTNEIIYMVKSYREFLVKLINEGETK